MKIGGESAPPAPLAQPPLESHMSRDVCIVMHMLYIYAFKYFKPALHFSRATVQSC